MKENLINVGLVLLGNFLVAVAVTFFVVPNEVLAGGVAGIAVALKPILPFVDTTLLINIEVIGLFIIGTIFLGKGFFLMTLLSTICYPVFLELLTIYTQGRMFTESPIIASLYAGILMGAGVGIVFRTGSSTGGTDIPALLLEKFFHTPLHIACLIVDGAAVILGITTYSLETALIGLIAVYAQSVMIDKAVAFGGQKSKSIMVISEKYEEILASITKNIDRGATIIHGEGAYSRSDKRIILCVVDNKQYPKFNFLVNEIDDNAFLIVQDAHEVRGNGFTYYKELDKFNNEIKRYK